MAKEYIKEDFTVIFHAFKCVGSLPNSFKPNNKRWTKLEYASFDELKETIDQCPSDSLTNKNGVEKPEASALNVDGNVSENPLLLAKGDILAVHSYWGNQLFCDGMHAKVDSRT